ncbi:Elongation factor G mitochondrial [Bienertia sinuspersici]
MKRGSYGEIDKIYYCMPGSDSFEKGLKKVYDDNEIRELGELALKSRGSTPSKEKDSSSTKQKTLRKKLTPIRAPQLRRSPREHMSIHEVIPVKNLESESNPTTLASTGIDASTSAGEGPHQPSPNKPYQCNTEALLIPQISTQAFVLEQYHQALIPLESETVTDPTQSQKTHTNTQVLEDYDWEDPRPENPLSWNELLGDDLRSEDNDSDPEYTPLSTDSDEQLAGGKGGEEVPDDDEGDVGEDRDEVLGDDEEFDDLFEGKLMMNMTPLQQDAADGKFGAQKKPVAYGNVRVCSEADKALSDYGDSGDDIDTPPGSDEEGLSAKERAAKRGVLVSQATDFSVYQWQITVSNKKRGERLGVKCMDGCPFKLYASWDTRRATFVLKTVANEHTCTGNMERNKQMKSTWLAEELLEVFKARPHWPAKEIIETVRRAYRVIVKKKFAYKVKYYAHKKLHGSMKEHYQKLGRQEMEKSTALICPRVQAKLEKEKEEAAKCTAKVLEEAEVEGVGEEVEVGIICQAKVEAQGKLVGVLSQQQICSIVKLHH